MNNITNKSFKNTLYFIVLCILTICLVCFSEDILEIEYLFSESLRGQITKNEISNLLHIRQKWKWLSYTLVPLFLIFKIFLISSILFIGIYFYTSRIKYNKIFSIVIKAEYIFLLVIVLKTLWLYSFESNYLLNDALYFYPLSALNIVGYEGLDPWFIYPLQVLNLFELAYWFVLAYLLGKELNISMDKGFKIVASSYGPALAIWVVAVMFFTLNYS